MTELFHVDRRDLVKIGVLNVKAKFEWVLKKKIVVFTNYINNIMMY